MNRIWIWSFKYFMNRTGDSTLRQLYKFYHDMSLAQDRFVDIYSNIGKSKVAYIPLIRLLQLKREIARATSKSNLTNL